MHVMGVALGIVAIGAKLAVGMPPAACVLSVDTHGQARIQAPQLLHDHPLQNNVQILCEKLVEGIAGRPGLLRALARQQAQISLHVLNRPNRLAVHLVLHAAGQDLAGPDLSLSQIDASPSDLDAATLSRLARHLLDAPPFDTFSPAP